MSSYIQPAEELCAKLGEAARQTPEEVLRTGMQYMAFLYRGLIAELKRATEWKPIATAPKNGTGIQAWCPGYGVRELFWSEIEDQTGWRLVGAPQEGPYEPTHYRDLPPGPA